MKPSYYDEEYEDLDEEYFQSLYEADLPNLEMNEDQEDNYFDEQEEDSEDLKEMENPEEDQTAKQIGAIYNEQEWENLVALYNNGEESEKEEAGMRVYAAMLPFIKYLAKTYYGSYLPKYADDLESEGKVGVFLALPDYNPKKAKPATWFSKHIIHRMRSFIDGEIHHTTPHYLNHLREIRKCINEFQTKGKAYTIDDVMIATQFPKQTVLNCMLLYERSQNPVSIEQSIWDNKTSVLDMMASPCPSPEDEAIANEEKAMIWSLINDNLSQLERDVISCRYGLEDDHPLSAAEISEKLGIKKQDIRPIISMAERKLRNAANASKHNFEAKKKKKKSDGEKVCFLKTAKDLTPEYEFEMLVL